MKYSLLVSFLLCLINLYDLQSSGADAAHFNLEHPARGDEDTKMIKVPNVFGCNKGLYGDSDSSSSSDVTNSNEIMIDNTKHFHEHNHNYLLIGLGSREENSEYEDSSSLDDYVHKYEKHVHPKVVKALPVKDEEEAYVDEHDAWVGRGTYSIEPTIRPKAQVVEEYTTTARPICQAKLYASLIKSRQNEGLRGDARRNKYRGVADKTRALVEDPELGLDDIDDLVIPKRDDYLDAYQQEDYDNELL